MASYRTAPRTWSTKACVKKLKKTRLLDLCERNETRRTHRAPMTSGEYEFLQSFAEAFANALAVRPCRNRTETCLFGSYQAGGRRREGPWLNRFLLRKFLLYRLIYTLSYIRVVYPHTLILTPTIALDRPLLGA